jgi:hypothetical protein
MHPAAKLQLPVSHDHLLRIEDVDAAELPSNNCPAYLREGDDLCVIPDFGHLMPPSVELG